MATMEETTKLGDTNTLETREIVENYVCYSTAAAGGFLGLRFEDVSIREIEQINLDEWDPEREVPELCWFPDPLPARIQGVVLDDGRWKNLKPGDLYYTLAEIEQVRNRCFPKSKKWVEIFSVVDFSDKNCRELYDYGPDVNYDWYQYRITREILTGKNIRYGMFMSIEKYFEKIISPESRIKLIPYRQKTLETISYRVSLRNIKKLEIKDVPFPDRRLTYRALFISYGDLYLELDIRELDRFKILRVIPERLVDHTKSYDEART